MAFAIGAYRAMEHLGGAGSGHRTSPFWRAEDPRTLEDVALSVLPVESAEPVRDIVEAVADIRHPHLLPVSDVVEDDARVALVSPWPRGGRLIELVRRRGTLSAGETITVLLPIAAALAEVHRQQVRHGWVCPEAVWFDARGRPLLGPIAVSLAVADVAGLASLGCADVAPEVLRQARTGPAGVSADVFSLGSVALFCLTGRSAWPADEPADVLVQSAAGQWPDPPPGLDSAGLLALIRSMLRADPGARPSAEQVVHGLSAGEAGVPAPIRFGAGPCPTPASSKRWRGWADRAESAAPGEPGETAEPVEPSEATEPAGRTASGGTADPETDSPGWDAAVGSEPMGEAGAQTDVPPSAPAAAPRVRRGPMARLLIAVLSGLLLTVLVAQVGNWLGDPPTAQTASIADNTDSTDAAATDWARVVTDLDRARSRALAQGDPGLLDQVYVSGSAAAAADAAMVAGLADHGLRVVDGMHDLVSVQVLDPSPTAAEVTRLAVVDTLAARPVVDATGRQVASTAARGEQRQVLVLTPTAGGYRISAIESG